MIETFERAMKVKIQLFWLYLGGTCSYFCVDNAPSADLDLFIMKDLSKSIFVGTRKMVNYGRVG